MRPRKVVLIYAQSETELSVFKVVLESRRHIKVIGCTKADDATALAHSLGTAIGAFVVIHNHYNDDAKVVANKTARLVTACAPVLYVDRQNKPGSLAYNDVFISGPCPMEEIDNALQLILNRRRPRNAWRTGGTWHE